MNGTKKIRTILFHSTRALTFVFTEKTEKIKKIKKKDLFFKKKNCIFFLFFGLQGKIRKHILSLSFSEKEHLLFETKKKIIF